MRDLRADGNANGKVRARNREIASALVAAPIKQIFKPWSFRAAIAPRGRDRTAPARREQHGGRDPDADRFLAERGRKVPNFPVRCNAIALPSKMRASHHGAVESPPADSRPARSLQPFSFNSPEGERNCKQSIRKLTLICFPGSSVSALSITLEVARRGVKSSCAAQILRRILNREFRASVNEFVRSRSPSPRRPRCKARRRLCEDLFAQRGDQCDDNARPGRADGMTERASAAMDIHFVVRKIQRAHRRHCDDGEGFIDFEQVDVR